MGKKKKFFACAYLWVGGLVRFIFYMETTHSLEIGQLLTTSASHHQLSCGDVSHQIHNTKGVCSDATVIIRQSI